MEKDNITAGFWKTKQLDEMSNHEWDMLCDNCGQCCMEKVEDPETGCIKKTAIACRFLDINNCSCIIYEDRLEVEPDCLKMSPQNIKDFTWLPKTCAYRRIYEGRHLEWWHPLISGDPDTVHEAGISVRGRAVPFGYTFEEKR